jgi:hypothetical protein
MPLGMSGSIGGVGRSASSASSAAAEAASSPAATAAATVTWARAVRVWGTGYRALTAIAGALSCALVELELADEPVRFPKKRTKTLVDALFHLYSLRPAPLRPPNISPCHTRTQGSDCRCAPRSGAQTVVVVRCWEVLGALSCDGEARKAYHHRLSEDAACRGGHDGRCLGVQGGSWGTTRQLAARSPVGKPAGTQVYNHKKKPDLESRILGLRR